MVKYALLPSVVIQQVDVRRGDQFTQSLLRMDCRGGSDRLTIAQSEELLQRPW